MEMRLLEKEKLDDKSKELYNLIKRDYKLIEKNCLMIKYRFEFYYTK